MGFWFAKNWRAKTSSMSITMGVRSLSCAVIKRPRFSVVPMACLKSVLYQVKHRLRHFVQGCRLGLAFDPEGQLGIVNQWTRAQGDGTSLDSGNSPNLCVEMTQRRARVSSAVALGCGGNEQRESDGMFGIA